MKRHLRLASRVVFLCLLGAALIPAQCARGLEDGLARTPPMGWNSWNKFGCNVSEELIKSIADAMATNGMKSAGYEYVVIDDCWQVVRDSDGKIVADPQRFPSGMKALADYVHAKGLKFGLYSCAGSNTCAGRPGSLGHQADDALRYAAWGVDYLKYDWCNTGDLPAEAAYAAMGNALKAAGRPIVFSLCEWGSNKPWLWAKDVGHLWRTTGDISDCWVCTNNGSSGWLRNLDKQVGLESYAGPGHWNDPDMLEVGNGGMTTTEYKAHFSLWCIVAAPLLAGNDVRNMSAETSEILLNPELIAVDQDALGKQGNRLRKEGSLELWTKPLQNGAYAVALFNRGSEPAPISVGWEELGLPTNSVASVRDLWKRSDIGHITGKFETPVAPHSVVVLKVTPENDMKSSNVETRPASANPASQAVPASNADAKARALLAQMTLDEKIGQITQVDLTAVTNKADIQKYFLGSMLSGGDSDPANNEPATWLATTKECQDWALKTRLKIPLLYGIDAVHGHNNILGAVIFPHNIGLGATHDPALVEEAARTTALEVAGTGIHWAFAPCVAVAQDISWGRSYESFSESPDLVGTMGAAAVKGLQTSLPNGASVLACAKHFVGDGGTHHGIDQGNTICDEATLRKLHLAPYVSALRAGARTVMVSYSSWNGEKMHGNKRLLTDVLKGELGFQGFLVSDWAAIDQLTNDYKADIDRALNAGLDMVMIPNGPGRKNNFVEFITFLKELVAEGRVSEERIDDAVRRILRVKFESGLFEHPYAEPDLLGEIGSAQHREVARRCVRESLVVLKNNTPVLPLSKETKSLAVVGAAADNLGIQCGGWTIDWQGKTGPVTRGGTTILEAIRKTVSSGTKVTFSPDGSHIEGADVIVVVIGELPYAEMKGDRKDLRLSSHDTELMSKARKTGAPVVTILLSGRPMVLGSALDETDGFIAAWLPGTEGEGVADVLFGDYSPTGKLPRAWPRDNKQLAVPPSRSKADKPAFPLGFGLRY